MATGDTVLTDDSLSAAGGPGHRADRALVPQPLAVQRQRHRRRGRGPGDPDRGPRGSSWGTRTYRVEELADQWDVLWFIQDRLVVVVPLDEPPAEGQQVDVEVTVDLRLPYMQIAPDEVRDQPRQPTVGPSSRTEDRR